ncbi:MAG TPA: MarR family transcriptional regulator [Rhizomicrobium sp.]|nr:MarR family transcriptional regulator [Rhizomicrobium sp.]
MSKKTSESAALPHDHVARVQAQWRRELPDVDMEGARILGRARRITLLSRVEIEAVFARHGIDTGEFDVIATLRRSGPPYALRPTELFQSLMISSGGLTDRLTRLEKRGLIRRRPSEEDRRSLLVELTAKGRAVAEAALREDMAIENAMVGALTRDERTELIGLLRKLAAGVEARAESKAGDAA